MKKVFASPRQAHYPSQWHMSPVVESGGFIFFSGVTGADEGNLSPDPEIQFRAAFGCLEENLEAAGLSFASVVEMTTYHVDLQKHVNTFIKVKDEFIFEPYPAWTAIGVSDFWYHGTLVEIRVIATRVSPP